MVLTKKLEGEYKNRKFKKTQWPDELYKDWVPKAKDIDLIRIRINEKIDKKTAIEKGKKLLKRVGINDVEYRMNQYPHHFSGGMRQWVMIAIAIASDPKLLIADELGLLVGEYFHFAHNLHLYNNIIDKINE